jgi:hypothetical protein
MAKDPWTDPDPQPGDFDAELALLDSSAIEHHDGDPSATLRILVSILGEDASRLERIARARGRRNRSRRGESGRALARSHVEASSPAVEALADGLLDVLRRRRRRVRAPGL